MFETIAVQFSDGQSALLATLDQYWYLYALITLKIKQQNKGQKSRTISQPVENAAQFGKIDFRFIKGALHSII